MTLDEYIEHFNLVVAYAKRGEEYATNFSDFDNLIDFNTEILGYLEELKTLRVELEKNSKELEIYKRALDLVCDDIYILVGNEFGENYKIHCDYADGYLKKAREE